MKKLLSRILRLFSVFAWLTLILNVIGIAALFLVAGVNKDKLRKVYHVMKEKPIVKTEEAEKPVDEKEKSFERAWEEFLKSKHEKEESIKKMEAAANSLLAINQRRADEIEQRAKQIQEQNDQLKQKLAEFEAQVKAIKDQATDENFKKNVLLFETMSPDNVASMFAELPLDTIALYLTTMKQNKVKNIIPSLQKIWADKPEKLTEVLFKIKKR